MNYFKYKIMDASGEITSGIIKLPYDDIFSAVSYLEGDESTAISVKKMGTVSSFFINIFKTG